ncbi:MAG: hypothetical protein V4714_06075 [Bacteroidota bacterium]
MKNFLFKKSPFLVFFSVILLISILMLNACSKQEKEVPNPSANDQSQSDFTLQKDSPELKLESTTQLREDDALITKLKNDEDATSLSAKMGKPQWDQTLVANYEKSDIKALLVPLTGGKTMIAFFGSSIENFKTMVLEIKAEGTSDIEDFSGGINIYVPSGEMLGGANYKHGKVLSIQKPTVLPNGRTDVNWSCFRRCFQNTWDRLPWYIRYGCGAAAGACFGGALPACAVTAGCVGGYAAGCLWVCR